jgi:cytochrome c oxidase cbb3-type subunit II
MKLSHAPIEKNSILLIVLTLLVVSIGGLVEIVPLFTIKTTIEEVEGMRPYTPLELAGRQIYVREGCYNCHSQMIRSLRSEVDRYGHYSLAAESMYDRPFQWGSKRNGPDLARVGGKYSDEWHRLHLIDPQSVVPESIMPRYGFLAGKELDLADFDLTALTARHKTLGVPYTDDMLKNAVADAQAQADPDADTEALKGRYGEKINVRDFDGDPVKLTEMDALVAYLQVLGTMVDTNVYTLDKKLQLRD